MSTNTNPKDLRSENKKNNISSFFMEPVLPIIASIWLSLSQQIVVRICADFTPNCSFLVTSTKLPGMIDFNVAVNIRYGAKWKIGAMCKWKIGAKIDKICAFPCFSYTILLLLKTENIEVGSKKKQLASVESWQKTVYKLKQIFNWSNTCRVTKQLKLCPRLVPVILCYILQIFGQFQHQ